MHILVFGLIREVFDFGWSRVQVLEYSYIRVFELGILVYFR